jgi:hypothetical protein
MFKFSNYIESLDSNINFLKPTDNIIETIINPSIKFAKRLKNRDLFYIEYDFKNILGPGIIFKNENKTIVDVNRNKGQLFLPINMFSITQIINNKEIKTLKTLEESTIIFETYNYIILDIERILSYANLSRFNKIRSLSEIKTYSDIISLLELYKKYYNYRSGK